ncbi:MAG: ATP-binding protein, partial [Anaerolineae bacterium]
IEKSVTLETAIDGHLPLLRADRQRILQVLLNLLSNACKFTEEGYIMVSASQRGDEVEISIQDTGPGIDEDEQTSVFEAFKQSKSGLRQGGGTGLGLPISRSLAEAHGGRLWFESTVGKGSTFFVRIPVKSETLTPVAGVVEAAK